MKYLCLAVILVSGLFANAQNTQGIFQSLTTEMKEYKIDTSSLPDDKTTRIIVKIRQLKGGFNINEAISFKAEEANSKGEMSNEETKKLVDYFTIGHGHTLLNNAVVWIYRKEFTYKELKQLARFYKTSAGQKLSGKFPVIMLKSLAAAEIIHSSVK